MGGESGVKCISGSDLSPVSNGGKQINEKIKLVHSKELPTNYSIECPGDADAIYIVFSNSECTDLLSCNCTF